MKKSILLIFLCMLCNLIFSETNNFNLSIGTIGGNGVINSNEIFGTLNGSLIDMYFKTPVKQLGLVISPLNYCFEFHDSTKSTNFDYSIINAELYYKAFNLYKYSFVGPFARINWLDFKENKPSISAGLRFCARDELDIDFFGNTISYSDPILFHYVNVELGYLRKADTNNVYLGATIDASLLGAVIVSIFYQKAEENTKKTVPDYKDRIPSEN